MRVASDAHTSQADLVNEANRLYEQYGEPLEADHWGEFVAISPDGRVLLGDNFGDLVSEAKDILGPGNYVFKIGPRFVGRLR